MANTGNLHFVAVAAGAAGNLVTVNVVDPLPTPNVVLSVTVSGNDITITPATNGAGNTVTSSCDDVVTAYNLVAAATALAAISTANHGALFIAPYGGGVQALSGGSGSSGAGSYAGLDPGNFKIMLLDTNQINTANVPVLFNHLIHVPRFAPVSTVPSTADSIPENFWPTPPMLYKVNSSIRFLIYVTSATPLGSPSSWEFNFHGVRRYPC